MKLLNEKFIEGKLFILVLVILSIIAVVFLSGCSSTQIIANPDLVYHDERDVMVVKCTEKRIWVIKNDNIPKRGYHYSVKNGFGEIIEPGTILPHNPLLDFGRP